MDEGTATARSWDDLSAEEVLARVKEGANLLAGSTSLEPSALGPKGEKRFYVEQEGENRFRFRSCEPDEPLPTGAKELTWEQTCEAFIYLKVHAEYRGRIQELREQEQKLAARCEQLAHQADQLSAQAEHWSRVQAGQVRSEAHERRKGLFWGVLGAESVKASRAFGRWIRGGP